MAPLQLPDFEDKHGKARDSVVAPAQAPSAAEKTDTGAAELDVLLEPLRPFVFRRVNGARLELSLHIPDAEGEKERRGTLSERADAGASESEGAKSSWRDVEIPGIAIWEVVVHVTLTLNAHRYHLAGIPARCLDGGYEDVCSVSADRTLTLGTLAEALERVLARSRGEHEHRAAHSWKLYCGSRKMVELSRAWAERRANAESLEREGREVREEREKERWLGKEKSGAEKVSRARWRDLEVQK